MGKAYVVGGGVRDLLLTVTPKDFDIVTDARPEQVKQLFSNCRLIGRRFRLAHVHFGNEIIEVATFRGADRQESQQERHDSGIIKRDNVYGTLQEDIWRRDITINALYYNISDFSLVDEVGGLQDIQNKVIRIIGDPAVRYREDPVRMLRVIRFAAKLDFTLEKKTGAAIKKLAIMLADISNARLFEEFVKLFHSGAAEKTLHLLWQYPLFALLLPQTTEQIKTKSTVRPFIERACRSTDDRIHQGKRVTPAFLLAIFLWHPYLKHVAILSKTMLKAQARSTAAAHVLSEQAQRTAIPKMLALAIRDIWQLQTRLTQTITPKSFDLLQHPRFRAGYDFLCLRAETEPEYQEQVQWWTQVQAADPVTQTQLLTAAIKKNKTEVIKKRPRKKKSRTGSTL